MDIMGIDINHIADLGTQVGLSGAVRALEVAGDEIFEYLIAIAILIQEQGPIGGGG